MAEMDVIKALLRKAEEARRCLGPVDVSFGARELIAPSFVPSVCSTPAARHAAPGGHALAMISKLRHIFPRHLADSSG